MVVIFKGLEICNFKSFKGKVAIPSFHDFVAIVGPNGCGKSNVIDAICFVMGEMAKNLRVRQISELIHGASVGAPVRDSVSVTAFFELQGGTSLTFNRSIRNGVSEFRINQEVVTLKKYIEKLEELGINMKAQNFVIYQGMVEKLATQTAKERTQQFEEISNSGDLKKEYNRLKNEVYQANLEVCDTMRVKKDLVLERKSLLQQMNEANTYKKLQKHYVRKQTELQLFKLYHIHKDVENYISSKEDLETKISNKQEEKAVIEETLKEMKQNSYKLSQKLAERDNLLNEMEVQLSEKKSVYASTKEAVAQLQSKITSSKSCAIKAKNALKARKRNIKDLVEQLQAIEEQKRKYLSDISSQQDSPADSVDLTDSQLDEYHQLKNRFMEQAAQHMLVLNNITKEQNMDKDSLDNKKRQKMELEDESQRINNKKEMAMERVNKLEESIESVEIALNEQISIKDELQREIDTSKNKVQQLQEELDKVKEQRQGAKIDNHLIAKLMDQAETVKILKQQYPGVYGRLSDLCKPIRSSFNAAVAKVFGKHMNSIIVATEKEALKCIRYLKEQKISRETFLPLDTLKVDPLKIRLRSIKERNVKLLYDVVNFSPIEIDRAILFVTNNTLVCETPEDANYIAYELNPPEKYNCVSLDGTYYRRSGIISGGEVDLQKNSRKWDEAILVELKSKEENLRKELRHCLESTRKGSQLNLVNVKITGLQTRLRFIQGLLQEARKEVSKIDAELEKINGGMNENINALNDSIVEIESNMRKRSLKIEEIKTSISQIEDKVFRNFCGVIGVNSIREFERTGLAAYKEREKKRTEIEEHYDRIYCQLEYEKDPETISKLEKNVERWERVLDETVRGFELRKEEENQAKIDLELHERKIQELKEKHDKMSNDIHEIKKKIASIRVKMYDITKEIKELERDRTNVESKIQKAIADCDFIFKNTKAEDLPIPTIAQSSTQHSQTPSSSETNTYELQEYFSEIDFSALPRDYKQRNPDDIERNTKRLTDEVNEISRKLNSIINPNSKAGEKIQMLNEKLDEIESEIREKRKVANEMEKDFKEIKEERLNRFIKCFQAVVIQIDSIYKSLVGSDSAQAILVPENPEEPYLAGIRFDCIVPGKRLQAMSQHSGGEKTLAVLALLIAQYNYMQPPFLLLDEIDAALDNHNIRKVAEYITKSSMQVIAVSLKPKFSSRADCIIGVTAESGDGLESKIYGFPKGFSRRGKRC